MTNRIKKMLPPPPPDFSGKMDVDDHKAMLDCIQYSAKRLFNNGGSIMPFLHIVDKDGCNCVYAMAMDLDEKAKDLIENMMIGFAFRGAKMVCFVAEAWMVSGKDYKNDVEHFGCMPSEHPNRREVVSVLYSCPDGVHMSSAEIYRPDDANAFVSKWKESDDQDGEFLISTDACGGRLASPYPKIEGMDELPGNIAKLMEQFDKEKRKATEWYPHDDVNWN